jgi:hypothetical protein
MIIVFFDSRGIVHKEFVPPEQTVNHAFYKDVLERLRKRVQRVRMDIADDWVLHTTIMRQFVQPHLLLYFMLVSNY